MKQELVQKLATITDELKETNEALAELAKQRKNLIQGGPVDVPPGSSATDLLAAIREDSRELEQKIEDLAALKVAFEKRLAVFKEAAPKAAAIRKQITQELWPRGVRIYDKIRAASVDVEKLLDELREVNVTMSTLFQEHEKLAGEPTVPRYAHVYIDPVIVGAVKQAAHLPPAPETLTVKVAAEVKKN
jgi:DNA repair exonuclease SbcCD ATPase subunit